MHPVYVAGCHCNAVVRTLALQHCEARLCACPRPSVSPILAALVTIGCTRHQPHCKEAFPACTAEPDVPLQSMQSEMDFTIIRPGGLKQEPATGTGVLSEDTNVCGAIHREDVAELAVRALFSPKAANKVTRSCFCAVTGCCGWLLWH